MKKTAGDRDATWKHVGKKKKYFDLSLSYFVILYQHFPSANLCQKWEHGW